ncbi:hypothetical protein [Microbacterium gubbeenense]|uniref:hypothetical protein n=1 Tax=Microbacterium gubbeenense TaxID=159896 RepID=UPI00055D0277|nr:hypothetical protein [Microbacterium gubbeenense]
MRLRANYYTPRRAVRRVALRIQAVDLPDGAEVAITDVQLQAGETPSGPVPNPAEAGTPTGKTTYRNGVIHDGTGVVLLANIDNATPTRIAVERGRGEVRVGSYRFGTLNGARAVADGRTFTATRGWGRVPVISARSDLHTDIRSTGGRAFLRAEWEDRAEDDSDAPG